MDILKLNRLLLSRNSSALPERIIVRADAKLPPVPQVRQVWMNPRQQQTGLAARADATMIHAMFDAADGGNPQELFAFYEEIMLGDSHLQAEFGKRKLSILGDPMTVLPKNKTAAAGTAAAFVEAQLEGCAGFTQACAHLLDATIWPVAVLEKVYRPRAGGGFDLAELVPVSHQLLDFSTGTLRIKLTRDGMPQTETVEADPRRYIIHRGHLLSIPDWRGGPLRSLVWWWLLSTMDREWWSRFLERYGSPFLVGKYDQADDASRGVLQSAFAYATKIGGLVVSRETSVELVQAAAGASGDAYEKFLSICQREKSKLVIGQTLSAESQPLGIGGGASGLHSQVRNDIRQFDALTLGKTLADGLFAQILEANGIAAPVPKLNWGGEDTDAQAALGELLSKLHTAGFDVTDEGLTIVSERLGLPLQRVAAMPLPVTLGARGFTGKPASGNDGIASKGAADLARAFSGALAPVRRAIDEAKDVGELEQTLRTLYADWPESRLAGVIEPALLAYAANGTLSGN